MRMLVVILIAAMVALALLLAPRAAGASPAVDIPPETTTTATR